MGNAFDFGERDKKNYESLFGLGEGLEENNQWNIKEIELEKIADYRKHAFRVIHNSKMEELIESVREYGVRMPVMIRKYSTGYECISGHRRRFAANQAGLKTVPCQILDIDDNEADILMVDSNNQREELLPSEKGWAYRIKLEAMNKQGKRTDLTSSQVETKLRSDQVLADESDDSRATIQRFIRLTYLTPDSLDLIDNRTIKFLVGVELSYLSIEVQEMLLDVITCDKITPSLDQAIYLKKMSKNEKLTTDIIHILLAKQKVVKAPKFTEKVFNSLVPDNIKGLPAEKKYNYQQRAIEHYNKYVEEHSEELKKL